VRDALGVALGDAPAESVAVGVAVALGVSEPLATPVTLMESGADEDATPKRPRQTTCPVAASTRSAPTRVERP
jgi:hypothetical protein